MVEIRVTSSWLLRHPRRGMGKIWKMTVRAGDFSGNEIYAFLTCLQRGRWVQPWIPRHPGLCRKHPFSRSLWRTSTWGVMETWTAELCFYLACLRFWPLLRSWCNSSHRCQDLIIKNWQWKILTFKCFFNQSPAPSKSSGRPAIC